MMYRILGVGLMVLITGCSAAQPRQGIQQESISILQVRAEIQRYHKWLEAHRRLLYPIPNYKNWPEPRQLDPETLEPIPVPEKVPPTTEEIMKGLDEILKELDEMPAGSPSPCRFCPPLVAGTRQAQGARAACIGG